MTDPMESVSMQFQLSEALSSYGLRSFDHWLKATGLSGNLTQKHIESGHPTPIYTVQQLAFEDGFRVGALAYERIVDRDRERLRGKREATVKFLRQLADTLESGVDEPSD